MWSQLGIDDTHSAKEGLLNRTLRLRTLAEHASGTMQGVKTNAVVFGGKAVRRRWTWLVPAIDLNAQVVVRRLR